MESVPLAAAAVILAIGAFTDWKERRIPNRLTVSALVGGWLFHLFLLGPQGLWFGGLGAATGFLLLLIPYTTGAMGAGDVKLLMGVGAWVGASVTFHVFLWGALIGAVWGLGVLFRHQGAVETLWSLQFSAIEWLQKRTRPAHQYLGEQLIPTRIPYGIPMGLGFLGYRVFGGLIG